MEVGEVVSDCRSVESCGGWTQRNGGRWLLLVTLGSGGGGEEEGGQGLPWQNEMCALDSGNHNDEEVGREEKKEEEG